MQSNAAHLDACNSSPLAQTREEDGSIRSSPPTPSISSDADGGEGWSGQRPIYLARLPLILAGSISLKAHEWNGVLSAFSRKVYAKCNISCSEKVVAFLSSYMLMMLKLQACSIWYIFQLTQKNCLTYFFCGQHAASQRCSHHGLNMLKKIQISYSRIRGTDLHSTSEIIFRAADWFECIYQKKKFKRARAHQIIKGRTQSQLIETEMLLASRGDLPPIPACLVTAGYYPHQLPM